MKLTTEISANLSAGMLMRAAFGVVVANLVPLARAFLLPVLLWCLAFGTIDVAGYYSYIGKSKGGLYAVSILLPIFYLGITVQFFANWKIAQASYAVSSALLAGNLSLNDALMTAKEKRLSILKLSSFVIACEALVSSCIFIAQFLTSLYYDSKGPTWTQMNVTIALLQLIYFVSWIPHMAFYAINGFVLATASVRPLNFGDVVDRFVGSHLPSMFYFCRYVITFTLFTPLFLVSVAVSMVLYKTVPWFFWREVLQMLLMSVLTVPIAMFFFMCAAVGGAFLSRQMKEE